MLLLLSLFSLFIIYINYSKKTYNNENILVIFLCVFFIIYQQKTQQQFNIQFNKSGITIKSMRNLNSNKSNYKSNSINNRYKRNVSQKLKKVVASAQEWKCHKCYQLLDANYEIDHIIPLYMGGDNTKNNLQALCRNCHGHKTTEDALSHQHTYFQKQRL